MLEKTVGKIALLVSVITLIIFRLLDRDFHESLLFTIAAATAVVPEGLPAAMSVALSLGAERMLKKKALVKKLLHVETLGSVTTICTDKTGTLTTGQMSVVEVIGNKTENIIKSMILCNSAEPGQKIGGDPLERALLDYAKSKNRVIEEVRQQNKKIFEIPFSSIRKMMTVVCQDGGNHISYTKGGCLEVVERCQMDPAEKKEILERNDRMAEAGFRVIAFASKEVSVDFSEEDLELNLGFMGLVGLEDPPRPDVAKALSLCDKAHIKVFMVTGDYGLTALAIAKEIGLYTPQTKLITGDDLHEMDDEALKQALEGKAIFARIEPNQKLRIVSILQEMGEIVAVTGDGVNDVPALVKADIGIAMGQIGTEVAKEAADMILLNDRFSTIVDAIKEGRRIYKNAKRFVFYVFSSNSGELFTPLIGILAGLPLPLLPLQILAIDLGTDVFPSLALGVEGEEKGNMARPPRAMNEKIMNAAMLGRLLSVGLFMAVASLATYIATLYSGGWHFGESVVINSQLYSQATASTYLTLVLCQFANVISCRSENRIAFNQMFSNVWLIWAEVISFAMLGLMMFYQPVGEIFHTATPPNLAWIMAAAFTILFYLIFERTKVHSKFTKALVMSSAK